MSFIYTSMGNLYRRSRGSAYINKGGIDVVGELLSSFHGEYYPVEIICEGEVEMKLSTSDSDSNETLKRLMENRAKPKLCFQGPTRQSRPPFSL